MTTDEQLARNLAFFDAVPDTLRVEVASRTPFIGADPFRAKTDGRAKTDTLQALIRSEKQAEGVPTPPKERKPQRVTLRYSERDIKVSIPTGQQPAQGTKRGNIHEYSQASERRFRWVSRAVFHLMQGCGMLTYPEGHTFDGRKVERDRRALCKRLARRGIGIIYGKEFQKNGQMHMHFAITKWLDCHVLARMWFEIVGSGNYDHLNSGTTVEWIRSHNGLGNYFAHYMGKEEQKRIPAEFKNAGRMWGYSRWLYNEVMYTFIADTKQKWDFVRSIKKWWKAEIRALYHVKWKRRNPAAGFLAWDGRQVFEILRAKSQPTTLTA